MTSETPPLPTEDEAAKKREAAKKSVTLITMMMMGVTMLCLFTVLLLTR